MNRYRVWDAPTRLFHWLLVALIAAQYLSGEFHLLPMRWHYWLGYATLALLFFRVVWGFVGSQTSRFGHFVHGPAAVLRHLKEQSRSVGHNPVGGWSVLALLASCLLQAISGLASSDDIDEFGPLCAHVSDAWVARLTALHAWNRYVLLALIGAHVIAVLLYWRGGNNLIAPMLHGNKVLEEDPQLRFAHLRRALLVAIACAAIIAIFIVWAEKTA
jgi:cytochrome b